MAFKGKQMRMHGAFKSKRDAERKEKATPNAFIVKRKIRGSTRYVVLSRKK